MLKTTEKAGEKEKLLLLHLQKIQNARVKAIRITKINVDVVKYIQSGHETKSNYMNVRFKKKESLCI